MFNQVLLVKGEYLNGYILQCYVIFYRPIKMPENFKIVVTDREVNVKKLREIGEVRQYEGEGTMPRDLLVEWAKNADAIFCLLRDRIDKKLLDKCKPTLLLRLYSKMFRPTIESCRNNVRRIRAR